MVIPLFNGEKYLAEAIESILSQTCPPGEIIVVNDGSTDGSESVALSFGDRVTYLRQENGGIGAARNTGVMAAGGKFFSFLDQDDLWVENKLEKQLACFEEDPGLHMVFGHALQFFCPTLAGESRKSIALCQDPIPAFLASSMLVKRDAFFRAGLYATDVRVGENLEWYARALEQGLRFRMLPDIVYRRRIHGKNTGTTHRDFRGDYVRVLKATLDRRRGKKIQT